MNYKRDSTPLAIVMGVGRQQQVEVQPYRGKNDNIIIYNYSRGRFAGTH